MDFTHFVPVLFFEIRNQSVLNAWLSKKQTSCDILYKAKHKHINRYLSIRYIIQNLHANSKRKEEGVQF